MVKAKEDRARLHEEKAKHSKAAIIARAKKAKQRAKSEEIKKKDLLTSIKRWKARANEFDARAEDWTSYGQKYSNMIVKFQNAREDLETQLADFGARGDDRQTLS